MKKFGSLLWGLVFIAVGIIVGLNSFKVTNIDLFFNGWWTLFIIVPCFIDLFSESLNCCWCNFIIMLSRYFKF